MKKALDKSWKKEYSSTYIKYVEANMEGLPIQYKVDINPSYEWAKNAESLGVSHRELEVLALITEGYTNKEVAQILKIKHQSVKNHIHSLHKKLRVKHSVQACIVALHLNMIKIRAKVQNVPEHAPTGMTVEGIIDAINKHISGENWSEGISQKSLTGFLK